MVSHRGTETREEGKKDRADETGKDGGGELERRKSHQSCNHRNRFSPPISASILFPVSSAHVFFLLPSLSFAAAAVAAGAAVIRSLYDH